MKFHLLIHLGVFLCAASAAHATTYQVGPTRPNPDLQSVAGILNPGDVVEVDGNATYPGGVRFTRSGTAAQRITIRGIRIGGNRPVISGATNTVELAGDHYTLEGFELTGGSFRCLYHHANDIIVRDAVVHDCPAHGILGADQDSGTLLLEFVEVYRCGSGTSQHQIYMATDEVNHPGSVFRMRYCYVHDSTGGNNVKSRAERNEIHYNWIEGAMFHELELIGPDPGGAPAGWTEGLVREDSDVVGNVLWKRNDFSVTRLGGDATGQSNGRYRFVNNTIIAGTSAVFRLFDGIQSVEMHNNVFHRTAGGVNLVRQIDAVWTDGSQMAGSNNWATTGSTNIPPAWTGTLSGTSPGFIDLANNDLRPAAGSPLLNAANPSPSTPAAFPFGSPHFPPGFEAPRHTVLAAPAARSLDCAIDIGAFERPPLVAAVGGLSLSSPAILTWLPSPGGTGYDVVKGDLATLRASDGDFAASVVACLEDNGTDTASPDPSQPPPDDGYFYLVRVAPSGTYDGSCPDHVASRDPGILGSAFACP